MQRFSVFVTALLVAAFGAGTGRTAAADDKLVAAKKQFETSCGTCHTVDPQAAPRQGPNLAGVYGRPAGTLPGYKYSAALANAGFPWDEASLDKWITNAQAFRPGSVMPYRQTNPDKRQLVIAYLKSLAPAK